MKGLKQNFDEMVSEVTEVELKMSNKVVTQHAKSRSIPAAMRFKTC